MLELCGYELIWKECDVNVWCITYMMHIRKDGMIVLCTCLNVWCMTRNQMHNVILEYKGEPIHVLCIEDVYTDSG